MTFDLAAIGLSLKLAAATTAILFVVGLPAAWWLTTTRWRGKFLVEAVVALPLVLPPTVLGFYLLVAMGPRSPLGRLFESVTGSRLPFSFTGLLVASVLYSLPFAVQPFAAAFARVPRRLLEASATLGASPLSTFHRVVLPLSAPGVFAGMILAFAHTVGEFGVVLMVGREHPGRHADRLDRDLRRRAGARLRGRRGDVAGSSSLFVRRPRRDVRTSREVFRAVAG